MSVRVQFDNGLDFVSPTPQLAVKKLESLDWLRYESIWDYKEEVQQRCTVQGVSFVAWDATSFLLGLQMAGICVITLNNQQEGGKK